MMPETKGAELLRIERARRRLSQEKAADLVECGTRTIVALELSQTMPRLDIAYRLWRVFGIPMTAWVEPRVASGEDVA